MKIPTLLGLFILGLISAMVIILTVYIKENFQRPAVVSEPVKIEQSSPTKDSVTITWQTQTPTTTELLVASDQNISKILQNLKDNRDGDQPKTRVTHIVTVSNLSAYNQTYVKISIQKRLFPTSAIQLTPLAQNSTDFTNFNPIVGSVVTTTLQPITDALVFLNVAGAYPLATGVSQNGNFILPLNILVSDPKSATKKIDSQSLAEATLTVVSGDQKSEVGIAIAQDSKPLPPIVLGRNIDIREQATQSAAPVASSSATVSYNFDVNGDGRVNNLDVTLVLQNIGKKNPNLKTDINQDGVIDQKDLVLIKNSL